MDRDRDEEIRSVLERDKERGQANVNLGKDPGPCTTSAPSRAMGAAGGFIRESIHLGNIDAAMTYQPWGHSEAEAGDVVREALTAAAKAILRSVPHGTFRDKAIDDIISARMNANAAISFRGRF